MWYGSNIARGPVEESMRHLIKYAESDDGIHWTRNNQIAIEFSGPAEYAICKPCVIRDSNRYRFCARGKAYRIYYAESGDGIKWRRRAEHDLSVSKPAGTPRWWSSFRSRWLATHALFGQHIWANGLRLGHPKSVKPRLTCPKQQSG